MLLVFTAIENLELPVVIHFFFFNVHFEIKIKNKNFNTSVMSYMHDQTIILCNLHIIYTSLFSLYNKFGFNIIICILY